MLTRIEIGTREHALQWLENKDETECYNYALYEQCPAGQYTREFGIEPTNFDDAPNWINSLARPLPHTWGALAQRAREAS